MKTHQFLYRLLRRAVFLIACASHLSWIEMSSTCLADENASEAPTIEAKQDAPSGSSQKKVSPQQIADLYLAHELSMRANEVYSNGELDYARELTVKAVALAEAAAGTHSPDHSYYLMTLAVLDNEEDGYEQAESTLEGILKDSHTWPPTDKAINIQMLVMGNLAQTKHQLGEFEQAATLYLQLIEYLEKNPNPEGLGFVRVNLAHTYMAQSPPLLDKAIEQVNSAIHLFAKLPESDPRRMLASTTEAKLLFLTGKTDQAKEVTNACLKAVKADHAQLPDLKYAELLQVIAELKVKAKNDVESQKLIQESVDIQSKVLGADHPKVRQSMLLLNNSLGAK